MAEDRVGGWSGIEQRRHKRVQLGVPIVCGSGAGERTGTAENISISGLLVRMQNTFEQDDLLTFSLTLPGAAAPVTGKVQVMHVVPQAFMGLEFSELAEADQAFIENYIATALPSDG